MLTSGIVYIVSSLFYHLITTMMMKSSHKQLLNVNLTAHFDFMKLTWQFSPLSHFEINQDRDTFLCETYPDMQHYIEINHIQSTKCHVTVTWTDQKPIVRLAEGPNSFHWKKVKLEVLPCCTKFHEPHVVLEYAQF